MKRITVVIMIMLICTMKYSFGEEKNINSLIDKLGAKDKNTVKEVKEEIKALGDKALNPLRKSANTKNRKKRQEIISIYGEIILDQKKNPQEDKLVMDSLNDEYYMARIVVLGILAKSGHMDIIEKVSQKYKEPAADDSKLFNDIIDEMRIKGNMKSNIMSPTMLEESYLIIMDKKINSQLENIISNENEYVNLRARLIFVYWQINKGEGNTFIIKLLGKTRYSEIKEAALSCLRNDINKNNVLLLAELRKLLSEEKNFETKQMYKSIISYLDDSSKEN